MLKKNSRLILSKLIHRIPDVTAYGVRENRKSGIHKRIISKGIVYLAPCQYALASSGNFSSRKLIRKCCTKNFVCYISYLFRCHSYGSMHIVVSGYFLDWPINQEHSIRLPRSQTNYQPFSVYFVRFLSFMWSTDLKAKKCLSPPCHHILEEVPKKPPYRLNPPTPHTHCAAARTAAPCAGGRPQTQLPQCSYIAASFIFICILAFSTLLNVTEYHANLA